MSQRHRFDAAGECFHVLNRGIAKRTIAENAGDAEAFFATRAPRLGPVDTMRHPLCAASMPSRSTLHVSLTPELSRFVESRVRSDEYQSTSEVVREALRLVEARAREPARCRTRTDSSAANVTQIVAVRP